MNIKYITSTANALIKDTCLLKQKKTRDERCVFITEGMKMLSEALSSGTDVQEIFVEESIFNDNRLYFEKSGIENIYITNNAVIEKLSDWKTPQGIVSINKKKEKNINDFLKKENTFFIILDGVSDPGNIGTIVRTSEAAGVTAIITTPGTADCFQPKSLRASMGSIFRLSVFENIEKYDIIYNMREHSIPIVATSLKGENIFDFNIEKSKAAVVFGNEGQGISDEFYNNSDMLVRLPMEGNVESLNVAVSAGIIMYLIHNSKIQK